MKTLSLTMLRRSETPRNTAFTLIELLTVMAIILVLAGLILNIAQHAQYKGSLAKATAEIQALSSAIEAYKNDNGTYPRDPNITDKLIPQTEFNPVNYKSSSGLLYKALSGYDTTQGKTNTIIGKSYFQFQPVELGSLNASTTPSPTSSEMYIQDPFGNSYGYSTAYQAAKDTADNSSTPGATPAPDQGYNPTFDLWSTAGYGPAGRAMPSVTANASPAALYSSLWVKNW